jgi:hypothetical protein
MFRSIGLPELFVVMAVAGLSLIPAIFYLLTLQSALERCSLESRAMSPGMVWLLLIPLFNAVWQFIVVINISKSLQNEFAKRNLAAHSVDFAKLLGLALSILTILGVIPIVGLIFALGAGVCWILYWVKIAGYSRMLLPPPAASTAG